MVQNKLVIRYRKVIVDVIFNICASIIPMLVLQLIVYPALARYFGSDSYGLIITIYSSWVLVSNSFGNSINNIRLINNNDYVMEGKSGDFFPLYIKLNIINVIIILLLIVYYCRPLNFTVTFFGIMTSICILGRSYLEVGFRIKLNYKKILINNSLLAIGYLVGCAFTLYSGVWVYVFFFGYFFSFLYCAISTTLLKEKYVKSDNYKKISKELLVYLIATFLASLSTYADKLILYPLMGGTAVSIYYTANILGKLVGMLINPINSVLLSYISKWKTKKTMIVFRLFFLLMFFCVVAYVVTLISARPFLKIFFPQWTEDVIMYLPITTVTVMITVLYSYLTPFTIKFCAIEWQVFIESARMIVYLVMAVLLWNALGLKGFCIATLLSGIIKLLFVLLLFVKKEKTTIDKK